MNNLFQKIQIFNQNNLKRKFEKKLNSFWQKQIWGSGWAREGKQKQFYCRPNRLDHYN